MKLAELQLMLNHPGLPGENLRPRCKLSYCNCYARTENGYCFGHKDYGKQTNVRTQYPSARLITLKGETKNVTQWAETYKISRCAFQSRLSRLSKRDHTEADIITALTRPVLKQRI